MRKKILVICPKFGNPINALSVHTEIFVEYFLKKQSVKVLASKNENPAFLKNDNVQVIHVKGKWSLLNLLGINKEVEEYSPDKIFVQYVPFMYGRGRINFSFVFWIMMQRLLQRKRIEVFFHELYYPFEFKFKSIIMYFSHHIMLFILGNTANINFASTEYFKKILQKFIFSSKKVQFLPIGGNLADEVIERKELERYKKYKNVTGKDLVLGSFGTFHPSKNYLLIFKILMSLDKIGIPIKFLMIGQTYGEIKSHIGEEIYSKVKHLLVATGKVDGHEVNLALGIMDIYIGYFSDGLSARRGSLIAALAHGIPIISTYNKGTDKLFFNQKGIYLFSAKEEAFTKDVYELIKGYGQRIKHKGKVEHNVYHKIFTWGKIFERYERYCEK